LVSVPCTPPGGQIDFVWAPTTLSQGLARWPKMTGLWPSGHGDRLV